MSILNYLKTEYFYKTVNSHWLQKKRCNFVGLNQQENQIGSYRVLLIQQCLSSRLKDHPEKVLVKGKHGAVLLKQRVFLILTKGQVDQVIQGQLEGS